MNIILIEMQRWLERFEPSVRVLMAPELKQCYQARTEPATNRNPEIDNLSF